MDENILIKSRTELVLDKHVDFIVNYGKTHDKYVISFFEKDGLDLLFPSKIWHF
jgi:hypothetical protein